MENKDKYNIIIKYIFLIILLLFIFYLKIDSNAFKINFGQNKFVGNNSIITNNIKKNNVIKNIFKYQRMLPYLSINPYIYPLNKEEIFNSREIYISDVRITPEYIKYLRPINETEEQKYKNDFLRNETFIDENLFKKKKDQYDYKEFCKLALNEKLINTNKIEYHNKPDISIIIPSFNKQNILLKSIRSIQNQKFNNIEIIIVNDCSNDNSSKVFNYLLETDSRIRIFHHLINMGTHRSRLDGILYSKGKYIILFDPGDLYEDNYVLSDSYNILEKYNLDSCKFLFRKIKSLTNLKRSFISFHVGQKAEIKYEPPNIIKLNKKVFRNSGCIWNRLVRANIITQNILFIMLNVYKNMWDDVWYNEIINKVSYSYAIFERVGYVYYFDGKGEGTPKFKTMEQKSNMIKEQIAFLYFDYNFCRNSTNKISNIIRKLRKYNKVKSKNQLKNFRSHFEVLNNLLMALIKDPIVNENNKKYCEKLLNDSKSREKDVIKNRLIKY